MERADGDPDEWVAEPPAECVGAQPVGGRSTKWIYWWRTPAAPELTWAELRRRVLLRTGRRLELESSAPDAAVQDAVFAAFCISPMVAGSVGD